jgi:hypothetical protein
MTAQLRGIVMMGATLTTLVLGGCTTQLNATRVTSDNPVPTTGAPYFLNFTRFEITATRRVAACESEVDNKKIPALVIETQLEAKRSEERDPVRHYVVDLESLQSRLKNTEVIIGYYDSGALKSLNASAEDRTGEVISSVVTTLGKAVVGLAGAGARAAGDPVCNEATAAAVAAVAKNKESTAALTKQLEQDVASLQHLTAIATALGKAWDASDRRRLATAMDAAQDKRLKLAALAEELKADLSKISVVGTRKWPANGDVLASTDALFPALTSAQILKWGSPDFDDKDFQNMVAATAVWARLEATTALKRTLCTQPVDQDDKDEAAAKVQACAGDAAAGLKYRIPVPGRLLLCSTTRCVESTDEKVDEIHLDQPGLISQLGPIFVLPLKSTVFSNKSVQAAFAENGMPQTLGVKSSASAEKAAATFGTVTEQFLTARSSVVTNKLERVKAETELLKAEAELATAKKALEPPKVDPLAEQKEATGAFQADTALLDAELANIKARAALEEARAASGGP